MKKIHGIVSRPNNFICRRALCINIYGWPLQLQGHYVNEYSDVSYVEKNNRIDHSRERERLDYLTAIT